MKLSIINDVINITLHLIIENDYIVTVKVSDSYSEAWNLISGSGTTENF